MHLKLAGVREKLQAWLVVSWLDGRGGQDLPTCLRTPSQLVHFYVTPRSHCWRSSERVQCKPSVTEIELHSPCWTLQLFFFRNAVSIRPYGRIWRFNCCFYSRIVLVPSLHRESFITLYKVEEKVVLKTLYLLSNEMVKETLRKCSPREVLSWIEEQVQRNDIAFLQPYKRPLQGSSFSAA